MKISHFPIISSNIMQVESGKLVLEEADFNLGQELEGLVDMHSVQCINQDVELVLDLSGMTLIFILRKNFIWMFAYIMNSDTFFIDPFPFRWYARDVSRGLC